MEVIMGNVNGSVGAYGGLMVIYWIIIIASYIYMAIVLQTIAKKTNTENGWFAWVPILNIILMLNIGKKPGWWILMILFIPFADIIFAILTIVAVFKQRNYPGWWWILACIPIVNYIVWGVVAWKDNEVATVEPPKQ